MFYVEKFTFFNSFFIELIDFIIQQINNHLKQIVDFIFLLFFLNFFFFPLNFPRITKQVKKIIFIFLPFSFLPFFLSILLLSHFWGTKQSLCDLVSKYNDQLIFMSGSSQFSKAYFFLFFQGCCFIVTFVSHFHLYDKN